MSGGGGMLLPLDGGRTDMLEVRRVVGFKGTCELFDGICGEIIHI